jgi:hypothetical protein
MGLLTTDGIATCGHEPTNHQIQTLLHPIAPTKIAFAITHSTILHTTPRNFAHIYISLMRIQSPKIYVYSLRIDFNIAL